MLQVRDENHRCLPGIECGDVGPKLGDHAIDTGYMRLTNVRVPRKHMCAKRQKVRRDGTYVKKNAGGSKAGSQGKKGADKLHYATMMQTRAAMMSISGGKLAIGAVIATRYSCVRRQGFADTSKGVSYLSPERPILDYQVQQYRIFRQVSIAFAIKITGLWMNEKFAKILGAIGGADAGGESSEGRDDEFADLPEVHASSAGLHHFTSCVHCMTVKLVYCCLR